MFQQVKQQLRMKQVVEFYGVRLNKASKAPCPFHGEKEPSFSVKGEMFKCFGCGIAGDLITFAANFFSISLIDACKKLNEDFRLGLGERLTKDKRRELKIQRLKKEEAKNNIDKLEKQYINMLEVYVMLDKRRMDLLPKKKFSEIPDELIMIWDVMPIIQLKVDQYEMRWHDAKKRINVN